MEGSASPTSLRMRLACFEEWASAREAEAGSAAYCRSWESRPALLSCSSPMDWVGTANCGGQKSVKVSSPAGRRLVPGGLMGWVGGCTWSPWIRVAGGTDGALCPWVGYGGGCLAGTLKSVGG